VLGNEAGFAAVAAVFPSTKRAKKPQPRGNVREALQHGISSAPNLLLKNATD